MGGFARLPVGQAADVTLRELERIQLSARHAEYPLIEQIKQLAPFRYIAISGLAVKGHDVGTGAFLLSDFPAAYLAEYYAGDYMDNDPLVDIFKTGAVISRDSDAYATPEARRRGANVLDVLRRHGIPERTIIRVIRAGETCGTVNLISDKPLDDQACQLLQHFGLSLHAEVSRPLLTELNDALKLTRGELYCLQHAARGRTSEEIARDQTYALDTINTYLKTATRKLGAQNRTQAVAEALRRQLIR